MVVAVPIVLQKPVDGAEVAIVLDGREFLGVITRVVQVSFGLFLVVDATLRILP